MQPVAGESAETERLLRQVQDGDGSAFDRLFSLHRAYLHRLVELRMDPRLRQRVDASDVVQEAHLEAARRLPDYLERPSLPLRLWLRQITYDRLLMMRRRHVEARVRALGRDLPLPDQTSCQLARNLSADVTSPSQHFARSEMGRRVREALEELSESDREVVLMRTFEGLSNQEVAEVLGIDTAAASKRYGRALLRLRTILIRHGLTESQT